MRFTVIIIITVLLAACGKNKFNTTPQLSFTSIKPDTYKQGTTNLDDIPTMVFHVTDAEGDLGFKNGKDTSYIYFRNLKTNNFDSVSLPDILTAGTKNFEGDIEVNMKQYIRVPNFAKKDTLYFDVYVKDFAKNKSNVVRTSKPLYYLP
jgi:hypothetical protein